jgi:hypothetical protein
MTSAKASFLLLAAGIIAGCVTPRPRTERPKPAPTPAPSPHEVEPRCGKIFYGTAESSSPSAIARLDNNEQILLACNDPRGRTAKQLEAAGVPLTRSQLQLLAHFRLLRQQGRTLRTAFPLLDEGRTTRLRRQMKSAAATAAPRLKEQVLALKRALREIGREGNTYTILFSYVVDGLVWDRFAERGHPTRGDSDDPLWSGVFWMLCPPRGFRSGTNSLSKGNTTFKLHWSDAARRHLRPFLSNWGSTRRMALEIIDQGRVTSPDLLKAYAPYGIFDRSGRSLLPTIEERAGNPLFAASTKLSRRVAELFLQRVDLDRLARELALHDRRHALVIGYHEWMWELVDQLERAGLVRRPALFRLTEPRKARPEHVGELIFLVRSTTR